MCLQVQFCREESEAMSDFQSTGTNADAKGTSAPITRRGFLGLTAASGALAASAAASGTALADEASAQAETTSTQAVSSPRAQIDGTFLHMATERGTNSYTDVKETFHFKESYFSGNAMDYSPQVATFAYCLALSAIMSEPRGADGKQDFARGSQDAVDFLKQLDCDESTILVNSMHNYSGDSEEEGERTCAPGSSDSRFDCEPSPYSIGLICGHRPINANGESYNLVLFGVRGGGYGLEWCSNLDSKDSGNHYGFECAAEQALSFLKAYIKTQKLEGNTKILMAGFSRAAATTNMTSGAVINEAIEYVDYPESEELGYDLSDVFSYTDDDGQEKEVKIYQKDFYAYCYESPAGLLICDDMTEDDANEHYNNIHSIINPCDLVPMFMPSAWKFRRYGSRDWIIPAPTDSNYALMSARMLARRNVLNEVFPYPVDTFQFKESSMVLDIILDHIDEYPMNVFLQKLIASLANDLMKSRGTYSSYWRGPAIEIYQLIYDLNNHYEGNLLSDILSGLDFSWYREVYWLIVQKKTSLAKHIADKFVSVFVDLDSKKGTDLTAKYEKKIRYCCDLLLSIPVVVALVAYLTCHKTLLYIAYLNASSLLDGHKISLCLAWLQAMDSEYNASSRVLPDDEADEQSLEGADDTAAVALAAEDSDESAAAGDEVSDVAALAADTSAAADDGSDDSDDDFVFNLEDFSDTTYREVLFYGMTRVYTVIDGEKHLIFENYRRVDDAAVPFSYFMNTELQACAWIEGSKSYDFVGNSLEGAEVRCTVIRGDHKQIDPIADYVFEPVLDGATEYEFTVDAKSLYANYQYDTDSWEACWYQGDGYDGGEGDKSDTMLYKVESSSDDDTMGSVCLGGTKARGSQCLVLAEAADGYEFDHWTVDGETLGASMYSNITENEKGAYASVAQICVKSDHKVVGYFKALAGNDGTSGGGTSGEVDNDGSESNADDGTSASGEQRRGTSGALPNTGDESLTPASAISAILGQ